jgi:hypothetical protein
MSTSADYYLQYVEALDAAPFEVTSWEASFLEDLLIHRPHQLSEKQQAVLRRMAAQYFGEAI